MTDLTIPARLVLEIPGFGHPEDPPVLARPLVLPIHALTPETWPHPPYAELLLPQSVPALARTLVRSLRHELGWAEVPRVVPGTPPRLETAVRTVLLPEWMGGSCDTDATVLVRVIWAVGMLHHVAAAVGIDVPPGTWPEWSAVGSVWRLGVGGNARHFTAGMLCMIDEEAGFLRVPALAGVTDPIEALRAVYEEVRSV